MKRYLERICVVLAFAGGAFAGWVDFNNDEPQAAALMVMAVTFLVGFLLPRRAWLWAIIVALCLPGMYLLLRGLGYQPMSLPEPGFYASLLALVPAFIGAYWGALLRAITNNVFTKF